jgi:hypothetical protein
MVNEILKLKLDSKEAFLLFKLMGFHSFIGYTTPYKNTKVPELKKDLLRIKNNLVFDRILTEKDGKLGIEPATFSILQACKLSENIAWLHINRREKIMDSYFCISSGQVIEVVEYLNTTHSFIDFIVIGDQVDFFDLLDNKIEEFNFTDTVHQEIKFNINCEDYIQLLNTYNRFSDDELIKRFFQEENLPKASAMNFIHSLKNHSTFGQLFFMSKSNGILNGIRFVLSDQAHWILTENPKVPLQLEVQNVPSNKLLTEFYNTYVQSYTNRKK